MNTKRQKKTQTRFRRTLLPLILVLIGLMSTTAFADNLKVRLKTENVTMAPGETILLTGEAKGGTENYRYRFQYQQQNGKRVTIRRFRSNPEASFTPKKTGKYVIYLTVKDGESEKTVSKQVWVKEKCSEEVMLLRQKVVRAAMAFLGTKEGSAKHRKILNIYNRVQNNMYRTPGYSFYGSYGYSHYTMTGSQAWCDTFVSAMFIKTGLSAISGVECGCNWHIMWLKHHNSFIEADDYVPSPGDIIFYCWSDSGKGDCTGSSGHVGIVKQVSASGVITVIEGNYDDCVQYRKVKVNSRYIRGYGVPNYESAA